MSFTSALRRIKNWATNTTFQWDEISGCTTACLSRWARWETSWPCCFGELPDGGTVWRRPDKVGYRLISGSSCRSGYLWWWSWRLRYNRTGVYLGTDMLDGPSGGFWELGHGWLQRPCLWMVPSFKWIWRVAWQTPQMPLALLAVPSLRCNYLVAQQTLHTPLLLLASWDSSHVCWDIGTWTRLGWQLQAHLYEEEHTLKNVGNESDKVLKTAEIQKISAELWKLLLLLLGCIECMRCRLFLPMYVVFVCPSVCCLSVTWLKSAAARAV